MLVNDCYNTKMVTQKGFQKQGGSMSISACKISKPFLDKQLSGLYIGLQTLSNRQHALDLDFGPGLKNLSGPER